MTVEFIPSNIHQGHYIEINGEFTGMIVNLYAYQTIEEYRNQVDEKIEKFTPLGTIVAPNGKGLPALRLKPSHL